jgi:hypothetical protein
MLGQYTSYTEIKIKIYLIIKTILEKTYRRGDSPWGNSIQKCNQYVRTRSTFFLLLKIENS